MIFEGGTVFIGGPLGAKYEWWWSLVRDEWEGHGYEALLCDRAPTGRIRLNLADCVRRAQYLVFNLAESKPNVYYELGYAHACGNERNVILMSDKEPAKPDFLTDANIWCYGVGSIEEQTRKVREILSLGFFKSLKTRG